ncbi:hypothetical protein BFS06_12160 [Clostridium perfringens]|uniref:ATP-dependent Clp protease ATP-binding subunit ClpX n=1 Tax=Clostridium perfringens TaxID=1502 RepID=A0A140GR00_CLOPF|nr:ATP-dependent Clp protease ATP-binding subunit ClpX [Clostridium perfringens]AMN30959.1 ATP-dependent Clp protease ATP-binding subunit ClpX [Clostridium perfringens]TBX14954.1 hypothetical protein BFS06_12160 [Clostridium perfringens]
MDKCSFCGKLYGNLDKLEEDRLYVGINANICSNCISRILREEEKIDKFNLNEFKPSQLKKELDKYVIGQDEAKKILAVEVYNHFKRINIGNLIDKTNILLIGDTGTGKTYLVETLAKILDLPLSIVDITRYTESGYSGDDVENIIKDLLIQSNKDVEMAQQGIIYIDEVDKIASGKDSLNRKDVSGQGVQKSLLKIIEGTTLNFILNKKEFIVDTSQILFIFGGAFKGLDEIIKKRLNKSTKQIGFLRDNSDNDILDEDYEIETCDLLEYGMMNEFVGRMPLIAKLNKLNKSDFKEILLKSKKSLIYQYINLISTDDIEAEFTDEAIDYIVEEAIKLDIGARGLKGVLAKKMNNILFELPDKLDTKNLVITKQMLENK